MGDNNEVQLKGLSLFIYFMARFKMNPSKAIDSMKKHNQDMSFLDLTIKEAIEEIS